jgi:hypothetical protein
MSERPSGVSEEVLALESRIRNNPRLGERMINDVGSLTVVLTMAELDLVMSWIDQGKQNQTET